MSALVITLAKVLSESSMAACQSGSLAPVAMVPIAIGTP